VIIINKVLNMDIFRTQTHGCTSEGLWSKSGALSSWIDALFWLQIPIHCHYKVWKSQDIH